MDNRQPKIIILASLLLSAVIVFFVLDKKSTPAGSPAGLPNSTPPSAKAEVSQPVSVTSPDGNWVLSMKEQKNKDSTNFRFSILDDNGGQKEIFSQTVPLTGTFSIPANTFSPDDRYVFLKETTPAQTNYIVLTSLGAPIAKDVQTLEISGLFTAKYPNYKITDVTGWGGTTLLVINTDKSDGTQGPSFWFDVAGRSFIQLSTRFN